jgi:hypothetical protein
MLVFALTLAACGRALGPEYLIELEDPSVSACVSICMDDREQCYGALARVFQRCSHHHPGNTLEQQSCFEEEKTGVLARLPKTYIGNGCEQRFDHCFVAACNGSILRDNKP